jgi:transglutaminase superfamily protein
MGNLDRWIGHSPMSDPAGHAAAVADLPSDIGILNGIVQGVLVHSDWLIEYGLDETRLHAASRTTLSVADRLDDILEKDAQRLQIRRPSDRRSIGTCRDFALMLCSFLRSKGVPSRLRCGFAAYFGSGWEDHWVCEYWDKQAQTWRLSDPQIDGMLKDRYRIEFDPKDVPRQSFVTAGQAWLDCRSGKSDPDRFGHGEVAGSWFVKVNLLRDHYVLNGRETSAWDGWRAAPPSKRIVREADVALLDDLASCPEQPLVEVLPDWLA